jgi:L-alanine-DL-glutamate epimerase-like enolase superfamily enzyme
VDLVCSRRILRKRRPLTISRGTSSETENLFVQVRHGSTIGLGEMAPIGYEEAQTAVDAEQQLLALSTTLSGLEPFSIHAVERTALEAGVYSSALAALNIACWDWVGKRLGQPVWRLLGLSGRTAPTSVTVGINPPDRVRELVRELFAEVGPGVSLKLKLGSPDGIEADKASFQAARQSLPPGASIRVDANGGWSESDALPMLQWLAGMGCEYVEQPVTFEDPVAIRCLSYRPLPVYLDESVKNSRDVPTVAPYCDGVNIKLMKCGGISEALRLVHTARAHGLRTMVGCFSESSLAIAAAAQLSDLIDAVDLDSHLNLTDDPFCGLEIEEGRLVCSAAPGLGVLPR